MNEQLCTCGSTLNLTQNPCPAHGKDRYLAGPEPKKDVVYEASGDHSMEWMRGYASGVETERAKQEKRGETVRIERHLGMEIPLYWIRHGVLGDSIEDGPYRLIKLPRKRKRP